MMAMQAARRGGRVIEYYDATPHEAQFLFCRGVETTYPKIIGPAKK